ncbi:MAG: inositol monophosphatase family protein, partial [Candidatus Omnitrophota bacterium]
NNISEETPLNYGLMVIPNSQPKDRQYNLANLKESTVSLRGELKLKIAERHIPIKDLAKGGEDKLKQVLMKKPLKKMPKQIYSALDKFSALKGLKITTVDGSSGEEIFRQELYVAIALGIIEVEEVKDYCLNKKEIKLSVYAQNIQGIIGSVTLELAKGGLVIAGDISVPNPNTREGIIHFSYLCPDYVSNPDIRNMLGNVYGVTGVKIKRGAGSSPASGEKRVIKKDRIAQILRTKGEINLADLGWEFGMNVGKLSGLLRKLRDDKEIGEICDVVWPNNLFSTGIAKARERIHLYGDAHRADHVLGVTEDGKRVAIQERESEKYGGSWRGLFLSGHFLVGESPYMALRREFREELKDIKLDSPEELSRLYRLPFYLIKIGRPDFVGQPRTEGRIFRYRTILSNERNQEASYPFLYIISRAREERLHLDINSPEVKRVITLDWEKFFESVFNTPSGVINGSSILQYFTREDLFDNLAELEFSQEHAHLKEAFYDNKAMHLEWLSRWVGSSSSISNEPDAQLVNTIHKIQECMWEAEFYLPVFLLGSALIGKESAELDLSVSEGCCDAAWLPQGIISRLETAIWKRGLRAGKDKERAVINYLRRVMIMGDEFDKTFKYGFIYAIFPDSFYRIDKSIGSKEFYEQYIVLGAVDEKFVYTARDKARETAQEAGDIMYFYRRERGGPLSLETAQRAYNQIQQTALMMLTKKFPTYRFIGERGVEQGSKKSPFIWVIRPLDNLEGFAVPGESEFSFSVTLLYAYEGKIYPLVAVINAPEYDLGYMPGSMLWATSISNTRTCCNGLPISALQTLELESAQGLIIKPKSVTLDLCKIATNHMPAALFLIQTNILDIVAAGFNVLKAGGEVGDLNGNNLFPLLQGKIEGLSPRLPAFIAGNPKIVEVILDRLAAASGSSSIDSSVSSATRAPFKKFAFKIGSTDMHKPFWDIVQVQSCVGQPQQANAALLLDKLGKTLSKTPDRIGKFKLLIKAAQEAENYMKEHKYQEAETISRGLLAYALLMPDFLMCKVNYLLGVCRLHLKQDREFMPYFLSVGMYPLEIYKNQALPEEKDPSDALKLREAIKEAKTDPVKKSILEFKLGRLYLDKDMHAKAVATLKGALEDWEKISEDTRDKKYVYGKGIVRRDQHKVEELMEHVRRLLIKQGFVDKMNASGFNHPDNITALIYHDLGTCLFSLGTELNKIGDARECFEDARKKLGLAIKFYYELGIGGANLADANYQIGRILYDYLGLKEEAGAYFRASSRAYSYPEAYGYLGLTLMASGRYEEALAETDKAIELSHKDLNRLNSSEELRKERINRNLACAFGNR